MDLLRPGSSAIDDAELMPKKANSLNIGSHG